MSRLPYRTVASAATVLLLVAANPEATTPARLVGHEALRARVAAKEPGLRLLDARPKAEYDEGHIPGAVWVDVKAASAIAARPGGLADKAAWSKWIAPLGIGAADEVLVYDGDRQLDAARTWWLLTYLGVPKVGLVDGNFGAWRGSGGPASVETVKVGPGSFAVAFRGDRLADRSGVMAELASKSARVIDARSEAEHVGTRAMSKRAGHVPTACHVEWTDLVGPDGKFLAESALRARLAKAGVKDGEPVITHCQGGGRASVDAFVTERLGHPTRNYYLGWSDWGNVDETPVATGKRP